MINQITPQITDALVTEGMVDSGSVLSFAASCGQVHEMRYFVYAG